MENDLKEKADLDGRVCCQCLHKYDREEEAINCEIQHFVRDLEMGNAKIASIDEEIRICVERKRVALLTKEWAELELRKRAVFNPVSWIDYLLPID